MRQEIKEKLDKIRELETLMAECEEEIEGLLGISQENKNTKNRKERTCSGCDKPGHMVNSCPVTKHPRTRSCSTCGKPGHRSDGCGKGKDGSDVDKDSDETPMLSQAQFEDIKTSQKHFMTSREVSENMELPLETINRAFAAQNLKQFNGSKRQL